nr:unnamed protein product [Callosobruchus analis]
MSVEDAVSGPRSEPNLHAKLNTWPGSRNYKNYTAINLKPSEEHGVLFGTLYNKYHGRSITKPGAQTVFCEKEEECILKSVANCAEWCGLGILMIGAAQTYILNTYRNQY